MRHLLGGVALAALLAAGLPAAAQMSGNDQQQTPSSAPSPSKAKPGKHMTKGPSHHTQQAMAHKRGGRSPADNMAEELNRQELQRVSQGQSPESGTTMPAGERSQPAPSGAAPGH